MNQVKGKINFKRPCAFCTENETGVDDVLPYPEINNIFNRGQGG